MKIKVLNWLLLIDLLTLLLVLVVYLIPSVPVRIVLGLPFLLFFPGYTLVEALFIRRTDQSHEPDSGSGKDTQKTRGIDGIERIALSFGMSFAVVALIGLCLNYTPWGIRLGPVLFSISAFILIMSVVAMVRRRLKTGKLPFLISYKLTLPGWEGSTLNKTLSVVLALAVLLAIGTLAYTVAFPKVGERFTEFYILGLDGKADNYPSEFHVNPDPFSVTGVKYSEHSWLDPDKYGEVTLGIVNQEQEPVTYAVEIRIAGEPVDILHNGRSLPRLEELILEHDQKWEQPVGFVPLHIGDNQKVEFLLFRNGQSEVYQSLHLWIDVLAE